MAFIASQLVFMGILCVALILTSGLPVTLSLFLDYAGLCRSEDNCMTTSDCDSISKLTTCECDAQSRPS
ncbi:unnamed protein product [Sphenostylis stenocarpa]|uniref:Uncharacterized protein n=1 Tax=Sphenostylis stenocarpa TaxID=92480 RepID=A0AA86V8J9_9FABA|nr:unnamed protein product [Sphenostylis stenocarpa]